MNLSQITILLFFTLFFGSCTQEEKLYTESEARRWADSAAQVEIKQKMVEIERNFEYRKKVEVPYRFGLQPEGIHSENESYDSNVIEEHPPLPDQNVQQTPDPKFKRIDELPQEIR